MFIFMVICLRTIAFHTAGIRDRDRDRERQTDRQRETHTHTETEIQRDRDRNRETEWDRQRDKDTQRDKDRESNREWERQRQSKVILYSPITYVSSIPNCSILLHFWHGQHSVTGSKVTATLRFGLPIILTLQPIRTSQIIFRAGEKGKKYTRGVTTILESEREIDWLNFISQRWRYLHKGRLTYLPLLQSY